MGIYDRDYYRKESPNLFGSIVPEGHVCRWLIGLNVALFFLQVIFQPRVGQFVPPPIGPDDAAGAWDLIRQLSGPITRWLQLDTDAVAHGQVWRLLTYAFVHDPHDLMHIAFNMLFLWWFGTDVELIYGSREFLGFYLVSAFLGGVAFQLWALTQPIHTQFCLGASGAVTAVLVLCACHFPQRMILVFLILPVPIWLFVVFEVAQDMFRLIKTTQGVYSPVASVVHLAGAAFGFAYYKQQWRVLSWWPDFSGWRRRTSSNLRLYRPESEKQAVSVATAPSSGEMDEHLEAKLDAVLEKVSRHGKDSLTDSERKILMRASEIYKRKRT